jgi:transposase-like protein/DDE family transposase
MERPRANVDVEYEGAEFGDARLDRRLVELSHMVGTDPEASFPTAAGNDAELEATYRFLNNERVSGEKILAPHVDATIRRTSRAGEVVVAHDTTEFNFGSSSRGDLGRVGLGKSHGFYGHFSLAVSRTGRRPLGILGFRVHERHGDKGKRGHQALQMAEDNESRRWSASAHRVERLLGKGAAVHVVDREGDSYALMAELANAGARFVVRMASAKRKVDGDADTVGEALRRTSVIAEREVPIATRDRSKLPSYRKHFPQRHARVARLEATAARVTLIRPDSSSRSPEKALVLNAVRVFEPAPPEGEPPVEWRLWTTEPVDSPDQVLAVVDAYRCRWLIEEYFKALKSGCAIEKRQLESSAGLQNVVALFAPIAWHLLDIRTVSRDAAATPAEQVLTTVQIVCLRLALKNRRRPPLPENPTARDAMLGIAGLGGHIKNNGDPGWIVLGRGLDKLLAFEEGYRLANSQGDL